MKMPRNGWSRVGLIFAAFSSAWVFLPAQEPVTDNPPPEKSKLEGAWAELRAAAQPVPNDALYAGKSGVELAVVRAAEAERYLRQAGWLRQFQVDYPDSPQAKEAKYLEALNLMQAVQSGDNSQEGRWQRLVNELRRDPALPAGQRYRAAAQGDFLHVMRNRGLNGAERLDAFAQVARSLAAEFPSEPGGYESLLGVARSAAADKSLALARELLQMPAPDGVKLEARRLVQRYELAGKDAAALFADAGSDVELRKDVPIVIYAWATWSQGAQELAKRIHEKAGAAQLIGLCLDEDIESARKSGEGLPGIQVYDDRGRNGALAQALKLTDAGWVYVIDRTGVVRSVRAQENWEQLLQP